jgi:hypothetical protein
MVYGPSVSVYACGDVSVTQYDFVGIKTWSVGYGPAVYFPGSLMAHLLRVPTIAG